MWAEVLAHLSKHILITWAIWFSKSRTRARNSKNSCSKSSSCLLTSSTFCSVSVMKLFIAESNLPCISVTMVSVDTRICYLHNVFHQKAFFTSLSLSTIVIIGSITTKRCIRVEYSKVYDMIDIMVSIKNQVRLQTQHQPRLLFPTPPISATLSRFLKCCAVWTRSNTSLALSMKLFRIEKGGALRAGHEELVHISGSFSSASWLFTLNIPGEREIIYTEHTWHGGCAQVSLEICWEKSK